MTTLPAPLHCCAHPKHNDAANLADRYVAVGESPPWPLLEQLLTDCEAAA